MRTVSKIILIITSFLRAIFFKKKPIKTTNQPIWKIGHRGAAGYCPENTFVSFERAFEMGADYIELDVQLTKDGRLAVIHDTTVNRTTNGKGRVSDFTMDELKKLDAGSWFREEFKDEQIPELGEVLDRFVGRVGLLIELKKPLLYPSIEEKTAEELIKRNISKGNENIIVQSFDRKSMKRFHSILPSVPVGILVKYNGPGLSNMELRKIAEYASFINPKITIANKRVLNRISQHGLKAIIWTIRNRRDATRMKELQPAGIVADYPDLL
ncbi:glycerophosphodiester phosphodiesterase family protein [Neobacillus sp. PS3-34]|uniref:glycerophosphodiester phosphodiesterase n=1 Tax=Neobacillus sp. PS3-34 TaxID=3070678 RepID=UPI0027E03229|nr:glycerophosphodiester phosphodiesterase family protein [Neobacillus sp. PS3-34]WML49480.1 glycerophosphodiester phosphodiesterase family protein [Neobacillus sp. PS3-34]